MSGLNLLPRQNAEFPPVERALRDPNGLLAVGGELTSEWLVAAYRHGVFPWFDDDRGPVLWWSPDPRAVLYLDRLRITRSLGKRLRNGGFRVTIDCAFSEVVHACAPIRRGRPAGRIDSETAADVQTSADRTASADTGIQPGTWITPKMAAAYCDLHRLGIAHSVEVWTPDGQTLAGGLYGVSLGRMFFGESMFSRVRDASKIALCHLARQLDAWGFELIDCQLSNPHLTSLGAEEIPRAEFVSLVEANAAHPTRAGVWTFESAVGAGQWRSHG